MKHSVLNHKKGRIMLCFSVPISGFFFCLLIWIFLWCPALCPNSSGILAVKFWARFLTPVRLPLSFIHSSTNDYLLRVHYMPEAFLNTWETAENQTVFLSIKWETKLLGLLRKANEIIYVKERKRQRKGLKFIELPALSLLMLGASHAVLIITLQMHQLRFRDGKWGLKLHPGFKPRMKFPLCSVASCGPWHTTCHLVGVLIPLPIPCRIWEAVLFFLLADTSDSTNCDLGRVRGTWMKNPNPVPYFLRGQDAKKTHERQRCRGTYTLRL